MGLRIKIRYVCTCTYMYIEYMPQLVTCVYIVHVVLYMNMTVPLLELMKAYK